MTHSHLRPMSFGEILDSAFGVYRRHFVTLAATTLIPLAPLAVISSLIVASVASGGGTSSEAAWATFPVSMLALVGLMAMWGALARQVEQAWTGGEVSVADGYRAGLRAFLPLLGASILSYVMVVAVIFVVGMLTAVTVTVIALVAGMGGGGGGGLAGGILAGVAGVIVFLFMAALAVVLGSALFAVLPAIVVERAGPIQAIRRSLALTRGARGRVAGVTVVSFVIVFLPAMAVGFLTGSFSGMFDPGAVASPGTLVAQQVGSTVVGALTTPFLVAALVLLYFDRRVRTEALDVQLATDALPAH